MSDISDLSKEELLALAEVVELWEKIIYALSKIEAKPPDYDLHVEIDRAEPDGYLGWVGCNEDGCYTFQPATGHHRPAKDDDE